MVMNTGSINPLKFVVSALLAEAGVVLVGAAVFETCVAAPAEMLEAAEERLDVIEDKLSSITEILETSADVALPMTEVPRMQCYGIESDDRWMRAGGSALHSNSRGFASAGSRGDRDSDSNGPKRF